jgi:hypothetical protein
VRLTDGVAKPQRVHASLLQDPHDQALVKHHVTGQLALIELWMRSCMVYPCQAATIKPPQRMQR